MKSSFKQVFAAALSALLGGVAFAGAPGLVSAEVYPSPNGANAGPAAISNAEVVIGVGKSQVVQLAAPYADLLIADPKVADVLPLNTSSVYVVGKTVGSTALTIYGPGKRLMAAVNVVVSADIEGLKTRLNDILPNERAIAVRPANQSIILSGTVSSPVVLRQVLELAESYAPGKVVNMLGVEGTQQVMLSVRFVEMERSTAKDLRLNISKSVHNNGVSVFTGDTNNNPTGAILDSFGSIAAHFDGNLEILMDALEVRGLVKTLAEPTLVAMSGDTASFLAGGEFPIPVSQTSTIGGAAPTITVEFKQFGVQLNFTPTILGDGVINLIVNPEVSSIDPSVSVNLGVIKVPGLKVRRGHTTVELRDGESFTIAGLLMDNYQAEIRQFPFIGDVPVLGALFRSNGFKKDQTELVVVVTPHLAIPRRGVAATPADRFVPPSDFELYLLGDQQHRGAPIRPEDRVLMTTDPTKGGVDGPHGHVLY